jgi:acyl carrier protein
MQTVQEKENQMGRNQIRAQVFDLLKPFTRRLSAGHVVAEADALTTDLAVDSADLVDLVLEMEERFHIQVPDSALQELITVGQVIDLVEARLSSGS